MASVALTGNVDLTPLELWILNHEVVQEDDEIICDRVLRPAKRSKVFHETEACPDGLVHVHHISVVVPRVGIVFELEGVHRVFSIVLEVKGPILCVDAKHR